jgi:hypothetical protein
MAVLNVTCRGRSADALVELDESLTDDDIRRIAVELARTGELPGLTTTDLADGAFGSYVVDRFVEGGQVHIFVRPKVPFG